MVNNKDKDLKQKDIESIIDIFNNSNWNELEIKTDEFDIFLSNDSKAHSNFEHHVTSGSAVVEVSKGSRELPHATVDDEKISNQAILIPNGMVAIRAPNLGTFYCQPKPGEPAFVEVGQSVNEDSEVCLLEVMKLFTSVRAGMKGTIREICVNDGEMVEYDQILMILEPSS